MKTIPYKKIGLENEIRICVDNKPITSIKDGSRTFLPAELVRTLLNDRGNFSEEATRKLIKPELDAEQVEIITDSFDSTNSAIQQLTDILSHIDEGLQQRYGATIDKNPGIPTHPGYIPSLAPYGTDYITPGDAARYQRIHTQLSQHGVRSHTNITGLHVNLSFNSPEEAIQSFRRQNETIRKLLFSKDYHALSCNQNRYTSYVTVCNALGLEYMPIEKDTPLFNTDGSIQFSYNLTRFKKFISGKGESYGYEIRTPDSIYDPNHVKDRVEKELILALNASHGTH